jgi:RNase P/RNase MRP subunit POP5
MADIYLDAEEVRRALAAACKRAGGTQAFGYEHGLLPMYLDGVLAGEREAGDKLLAALGLVRITRYKRINPKAKQGAA